MGYTPHVEDHHPVRDRPSEQPARIGTGDPETARGDPVSLRLYGRRGTCGQEPGGTGGRYAAVRSWVRADRRTLDPVLHDAVLAWLERDWPFDSIEYAPRT